MFGSPISVFIDNLDARELRNSSRLNYLSAVQAVAKEVKYPAEKRRLILEDCEIYRSAMKKEMPTKVRKLAANPITLRDIAKAAVKWRKKAQKATNTNRRRTYFQRSAFLALLSLTPLRLRDVNALEVGTHVIRQDGAWVLHVESNKTNFRHNGPLHHSLTPYLDDLLLYGEKGLCLMRYAERIGTRLFANHIDEPLSLRTLAAGFKVATGHSPHIVRTLVHDAMAVHGKYGSDLARVLCGQTSIQTAKIYEVHAERSRTQKAQEVLAEIQRQMPSSVRVPVRGEIRLSCNIERLMIWDQIYLSLLRTNSQVFKLGYCGEKTKGGNQTFATTAKATCQIGKADVQVLASQNWDAALHDKVSYGQISIFVPIYFKIDQANLCSNAVHSRCRSQQLNQ